MAEDGGPIRLIDERTGLQAIPREECLLLLQAAYVGRLALVDGEQKRPVIFPVNFVLDGLSIVVRTAPGTKLVAASRGGWAAFEIDSSDPLSHTGWSVIAGGPVRRVTDPDELKRFEALRLRPWARGERSDWIVLRIEELTGRRLVTVAV